MILAKTRGGLLAREEHHIDVGSTPSPANHLFIFGTQLPIHEQKNVLYGWEEESPYQQEDTTPITSAIVKVLAHTEIPLTTSELWDKLQGGDNRFESKRRMKIALKQLRGHGYIAAVPNRGMKRGDLRDSYVITLTHKVKLPPGVVALKARDIAPSRRRPVRLGSEEGT